MNPDTELFRCPDCRRWLEASADDLGTYVCTCKHEPIPREKMISFEEWVTTVFIPQQGVKND